MKRALATVLVPTIFAAGVVRGDTIVVDPGGAGDFTEIQDAVDAAVDGDLVLVRDGLYGPVDVPGKAISIVADEDADVECGTLHLHGLAAERQFLMTGIVARGAGPGAPETALGAWLEASAGTIVVSECSFVGDVGWAGARVEDCPRVFLVRGALAKSSPAGTVLLGGDYAGGLEAVASTIAVFDARVTAGGGGDPASPGASLEASTLFLSAALVRGGQGSGDDRLPGAGGAGLEATAGSVVYGLDASIEGGPGGFWCDLFGDCYQGNDGPATDLSPDSTLHANRTDAARLLDAPTWTPDWGTLALTVEGEPGDTVELLFGRAADFELLPERWSARGLASPQAAFLRSLDDGQVHAPIPLGLVERRIGVLEDERLVVDVPILPLGPGAELDAIYLLQARVTSGSDAFLTNPVLWRPVDMPSRAYVDAGVLLPGDGSSWSAAYADLQDALEAESPAGTLWVAEGTYLPSDHGDVSRSFEISAGRSLYGGFAGGETSLAERDPVAHPTVLSGDLLGNDGPGFTHRADNSRGVLSFEPEAASMRLDGFVIRGSTVSPGLDVREDRDATVANCTFVDNDGGGMRVGVLGCTCDPLPSDVSFVSCAFLGNERGATVSAFGPVNFENCLFTGNRDEDRGAALQLRTYPGGAVHVVSSTFVANAVDVSGEGGAVYVLDSSQPGSIGIHDSILWANTGPGAPEEDQLFVPGPLESVEVTFSCLEGWATLPGHDVLSLDPLFVDADGADDVAGTLDDDPRLGPGSPCVDAGRNGWLGPDVADLDHDGDREEQIPLDLAGNPRRVDDPAVVDTGLGQFPITDMGALERVP